MSLWDDVLPVVQAIKAAGGNFTSIFLNRSVSELLDQAAMSCDGAAVNSRERILRAVRNGQNAFSAIFESYHEALFYLLAKHRNIQLRHIPEVKNIKTPDFSTDSFDEHYEVKTLDFSGGMHAYAPIAAAGRKAQETALEDAKTRGVGSGVTSINPHGEARNWLEVMQRVIRQIGNNVKEGQFDEKPTILVVALPRTSIRGDADELKQIRHDPRLGRLNGHLWTLAAHRAGDHFWWPNQDDFDPNGATNQNDNGPLDQNGILRDYPFVQAVLFVQTIWHKLGSADFFNPSVLDDAYLLHGVWNDAFTPLGEVQSIDRSSFFDLCHASVRMA